MAAAGGTPGAGRRAVYPRRGGIPFPICDGSGGGVAFLPGVSAGGGRPLGHCACVVGAGGLMLAAGVPPSPRPICDGGGCGGGSLPAACLWLWSSFSVGLLGSLRRRPFDGLLFGSGRARCLRPPTGGRSCGPLRCRRRRGGGSGGRGDGSGIAALHGPAAHTTAGTVATLIACSSRRRNSSRARRRKGGGASSFGVV